MGMKKRLIAALIAGCTTRGDEYIATLSARARKCAQAHTLLYNTKKRSFK